MSSDYVNVWDIIDTFFRDTENFKSQHHLDSYNGIYILKREWY